MPLGTNFCSQCGASVGPQQVPLVVMVPTPQYVGQLPAARARGALIVVMWSLTLFCVMMTAAGDAPVGLLADLVALAIAIVLVCGKSSADKVNGWVKIGLEIAAFAFAFAAGFSQAFVAGVR